MKFLSPIIFSQEWIHKITDNLLIKSKAEVSKGRDNYGRNKLSKQPEQTCAHPAKKEKKLIDENQAIYGIGYFNPAFDDNQCGVVNTPESSPADVPHRSRKSSSAKSEKVKTRIVDVSRTVRRKLDMSSVPDVVQTSQPQVVQVDDDLPSPCSDTDVHTADEEEFFLAKNSKLFSQVSSNTLTATETKADFRTACAQQNPFRIVEVKEMEIVKSIASPEDHVILPSANVSVGLMPQVVERVEIVEDTETEAESIDTDTEDKEVKGKISSGAAEQKKKELVPILKKKASTEPPARNIKRLILKLDLDTDQETDSNKSTPSSNTLLRKEEVDAGFSNAECSRVNQQLHERSNKSPKITSSWKDTESVAEYLILDDEEIEKSDIRINKQAEYPTAKKSVAMQEGKNNQKEMTSEKRSEHSTIRENIDNASRSEEDNIYKKSPLLKRIKNLSKDDTLEDCESFYGSDKETDDALIFSDDTEIDVGSSSSDGEDANLGEHVEHLLDKVTCMSHRRGIHVNQSVIYFKCIGLIRIFRYYILHNVFFFLFFQMKVEKSRPVMQHKMETRAVHEKALFKNPMGISRTALEKNILEFEQLAQMMLCRMDVMLMSISGISNEKDPTKRLEVCIIYLDLYYEQSIIYSL